LVVSDAGDDNAYDHGDWANARLTKASALSAPINLTASLVNQKISLGWIDTSSNEVGFRVLRKTGAGGTYSVLADLAAGSQSYIDSTAQAGQTYYYRVYAYDGSGSSDYSNEVSIKKKH
jgi:fibronectin type 3 domain-containing protein